MRFYLNNECLLNLEKLLQVEEAFFMLIFVGLKKKRENKKYTIDY
jgi:hypothetical protein